MNVKASEDQKSPAKLLLPVIALTMGLILLVLNIYIEDEPGGVPLLVVLMSIAWLTYRSVKLRSQRNKA